MEYVLDTLDIYCRSHQNLEHQLQLFLDRHRLLQNISHLGLAVSGGADSVALLYLMLPRCQAAGIRVTVLHFNHGLREAAADDERFVQNLAEAAHVPFVSGHAGQPLSETAGHSIEMAARQARMAFFQKCRNDVGLTAIATGHQADDVAETLFLRLARGAGATGLSGLRPHSRTGTCPLIRPLLTLSGTALRAWLKARHYTWREDESNRDEKIPRNFVRHTLLPSLERTWTSDLRVRLCQSAETLREDDDMLETLAVRLLTPLTDNSVSPSPLSELDITGLLQHPLALQRRILRIWLFQQGHQPDTGFETVQALLDGCRHPGDWSRPLPGKRIAAARNGRLSIRAATGDRAEEPPVPLPVPTAVPLRWGDVEITAMHDHGVFSLENGIGHYPAACTVSEAALQTAGLVIRSRAPGDRIAPTGMKGSKKLQDLFVDAKVPDLLRDRIPLVACGNEIVWVPGYRVSKRFAVPAPDAASVRITVQAARQPK